MPANPVNNVAVSCPLCGQCAPLWQRVPSRDYHRCPWCDLIFVNPEQRIAAIAELGQYQLHRNFREDAGYLAFQDQLLLPMREVLAEPKKVLDYGSGPNPVLAQRVAQLGHSVSLYDKYFAPDELVLQGTDLFDVITCVEVIEHINELSSTLELWAQMLRPGGWLGVMTLLWQDQGNFADWWYQRDPTHISFFTPQTIDYISRRFAWRLEYQTRRVFIWQKVESAV